MATVAAAAEGYPFVPPEWMPSVLVPTVGLIVPAIGMAWVSLFFSLRAPRGEECSGRWRSIRFEVTHTSHGFARRSQTSMCSHNTTTTTSTSTIQTTQQAFSWISKEQ